jgi:hypothetical protein
MLADMQRFAQSLDDTGLPPILRARTLAAVIPRIPNRRCLSSDHAETVNAEHW